MFTFDQFSSLSESLFSDRCGSCGLPSKRRRFCQGCERDMAERGPGCRFCGTPMDYYGMVCGQCLQHTQHYRELVFCHDYAGPLAELIKGLKYYGQLSLAPALGQLLVNAHGALEIGSTRQVTALPMHLARYRSRGFNQAALLADYYAKELQLTRAQPLTRTMETPPLEKLDRKARERAVRNAFASEPVSGDWILVDDVFTTGATVNAASRALRRAGANAVTVICLARTPLSEDSHHSLLNQGFHDTQVAEDD